MGEIYRSVSVTGTRMLLTQRSERIAKEKREKQETAGATSRQAKKMESREGSGSSPGFDEKVRPGTAENTTGSPKELHSPTESLLQKDLIDIQQKRLEQLEQEKQNLEELLTEQVELAQHAQAELQASVAAEESKGYQVGYEKALEEVNKASQEKVSDLNQAIKLFSEALQSQVGQVDQYAVEMAFAALGRIVGEQQANADFTKAVVTEALTAVRGASKVVVGVSQRDYDVLQGLQKDLASEGQFGDFQLVADPRVRVGGCLIETGNGAWDARLETQLLRLKDTVEHSLKKHQ
jgi:flagellar assembly protein FliH